MKTINHLMFLSGYIYRLLHKEAQCLGIRWTALMVLMDLKVIGPSNQKTLADIEQLSKPTITALLQEMEAAGWIERIQKDDNKKEKIVKITEPGLVELKNAGDKLRKRLEKEMNDIPKKILKELDNGLGVIVDNALSKHLIK